MNDSSIGSAHEMAIVTHKSFYAPSMDSNTFIVCGEDQGIFPEDVAVLYVGGDSLKRWADTCAELLKQWAVIDTSKADMTGFCQYKRQWLHLDMTEQEYFSLIKDKKDIIVPPKLDLGCSVQTQYNACHPSWMLDEAVNAILEANPEMENAVHSVLSRNWIYPHNMYIAYTDTLKDYMDWLKSVFSVINKRHCWHNSEDVKNTMAENGRPDYDIRCHAFLAERLLNIYLEHHHFNCIEKEIR